MTAAEKEYGTALYELAVEEGCVEQVQESLELVCGLLAQEPKYARVLQDPALPKSERLHMLDEAFQGSVQPYVLNFLKLLCEKSAMGLLEGCGAQFRALRYEAEGILPVVAASAVPLTEDQRKALADKLAKETGKKILLENRVDESLMGGVKVSYEGKELDGSVAGRLNALRRALMSGGV